MDKKIDNIIEENARRQAALNMEYDPYTGKGSLLPRTLIRIEGKQDLYLPNVMMGEPIVGHLMKFGSMARAADDLDMDTDDFERAFTDCRLRHDFEFWAVTCATVEDGSTGANVPMVLKYPQRKSLAAIEKMRAEGKPVRELELKHRQYGSTTMKNAYICWLQNIVYKGYKAYLCSLDSDGAKEIMRRYEVIGDNHPADVGIIKLQSYRGARNTFKLLGRDALIYIGTAENPNAPSGRSPQIVLISEAGKMKDTTAKGASKLITNMVSMVKDEPETFLIIESTAEISGKWFRDEVYRARNGQSGYHLTFMRWLDDPECQKEVDNYASFIRSFGDYEWFLWGEGASLEQIYWYKRKEKLQPTPWRMKQENPTTIEEAFQGSGRRVLAPSYVQNARKTCKEPKFIGNLYGDGEKGKPALKNITFEEEGQGHLKIWAKPNDPDPGFAMRRRYCGFVDIGGRTDEADYSVVSIFDRYWMMYGAGPERVATWRGHLDQDLFAWQAARIAKWYNNALLAVEINSLRSKTDDTEGIHHKTILDQISRHYGNLFTRSDPEKVKEGAPTKYGFHMNAGSKDMIITTLNGALRDESYAERDYIACDEMDAFEFKENGTMGAKEGMHDDVLITTAGGVWLATEYMRAPAKDDTTDLYEKYGKNKTYNEAMI